MVRGTKYFGREFWEKNLYCTFAPSTTSVLVLQWRQLLEQLGFIVHDDKTLKAVAERSGFREALLGAIEFTGKPILITQAERWPLTMLSTFNMHGPNPVIFNARHCSLVVLFGVGKSIINFGFRIFPKTKVFNSSE